MSQDDFDDAVEAYRLALDAFLKGDPRPVTEHFSRRDDVIPYGPFLCLAAATVVVFWAPIWNWAQPMFGLGVLVPAVLVICLTLLGAMLFIWRLIKELLLGRGA